MHLDRRIRGAVPRGVTICGILVAVAVLALLFFLIVPTIHTGHPRGKRTTAVALLARIASAMEIYREDQGAYPPDWIPATARLHKFVVRDLQADQIENSFYPDPPVQCGAEALYYYLCNQFLMMDSPLLFVDGDETTDRNGNGIPEICDPWGRPVLYDRPPFPIDRGYDCPDSDGPKHNKDRFDVYVIHPTGMFGGIRTAEPGPATLRRFNTEALKTYGVGERDDVIGNW